MAQVYLSTGYFPKKTGRQTAEEMRRCGVSFVELSGGSPSTDIHRDLEYLTSEGICFQLHNYFPPPVAPFVLNLASPQEAVISQSEQHCRDAIDISAKFNCKYYSVHAGFCIDPDVKSLGSRFRVTEDIQREYRLDQFISVIKRLKSYADKAGVSLLFENNVVIKGNVHNGIPLLLCCNSSEINYVKESTGVGLLLDIGHLIVSCDSLGLKEQDEVEACMSMADALHLSSNNRKSDQNKSILDDKRLLDSILLNRKKISYATLELNTGLEAACEEFHVVDQLLR